MVVPIGTGPPSSEDLVDLLLECQERIRRFTALARAVGERPCATEEEILDACTRVERYFTRTLVEDCVQRRGGGDFGSGARGALAPG